MVQEIKEFHIGSNDSGQRLDRFISKAVPLLPESLIQKYIRLKRIKRNGKGAKRDTRLETGDVLQLYVNDEFFEKPDSNNIYLKVTDPRLDIVYEDENIILINKQPGVLCHSTGRWDQNTLVSRVQAHGYIKGDYRPRAENSFAPALCNRIDRNTGGIVIAAKNAPALRIINEKIKLREIDKYYLCAVKGRVSPETGTLTGFLYKDEKKNQVFVRDFCTEGAKQAITQYRTLDYSRGLSLLECRLITGRTHQIRAQLSHAGYPLLGDSKYAAGKKTADEPHQALWSYKLCFAFKSDAGVLEYLKDKCYYVNRVPFVEKYFNNFKLDSASIDK